MQETVEAALRHGVAVGAHPAYPDREGFGRRPLDVHVERIRADVLYQLGALEAIARAGGGRVTSVKPHGALYHRLSVDGACAAAVAGAMRDVDDELWLVAPAGSLGAEVARSCGVRVAEEAFCDRAYASDGTLVPRDHEGALIEDPAEASRRAVRLVQDHAVDALDGRTLVVAPATLCVHGDTPGAASLAAAVRESLEAAGWTVRAFSAGA